MIFYDTFRKSSYEREKENLESSLVTKAWITHIIMMVSRIVYPLLGVAYWQKAYRHYEKNENIEKGFV